MGPLFAGGGPGRLNIRTRDLDTLVWMKRWTAAGLALAIAVLSPGTGAYNALAQTAARAGASGTATRLA
ncbi:MAG: hypothetical protein FD126_2790, partial [Elusimicrobia bacterium]